MRRAFKRQSALYYVFDYMEGGELFEFLKNKRKHLTLDAVKFYAAEILLALEHLHKHRSKFKKKKKKRRYYLRNGLFFARSYHQAYNLTFLPRIIVFQKNSCISGPKARECIVRQQRSPQTL